MELDVYALNLENRIALLSDSSTIPITDLIGEDGEVVDSVDEALIVVAGRDGIGWWAIDLSEFETFQTH